MIACSGDANNALYRFNIDQALL